ncbi:hypothetical protein BKA56DRAFT_505242 [Ilyonectria sp. MPI-CAGE-AT-0026]|nr:hypothetical protein BKA56DRAFT_505242 [Ilyonectria sp. MPI-CAGE-AT-0026]
MSGLNNESIHENNESNNESNNQPNSQSSNPNSDLASAFVKRLENYQRVSKDVWADWDRLQVAGQDATAKIFADEGGFETWFAYYLVKYDTETAHHKKGKSSSRILLEDLEHTSPAYRRGLAKRVSTAISREARNKAKKLLKRNTRVRLGQTNTMTQHGDEGQRVVEHCDPASSNDLPSSAARLSDAAAPLPSTLISPGTALPAPPLMPKQDSFHKADILAASTLFKGELYNSIERDLDPHGSGYTAAISMVFTYYSWGTACVMALDIAPDMASYFAREWFDVPFRTKSGARYLSFANGSSQVSASTDFLLKGCHHKAMASAFSEEIIQAIVMNPFYTDETQQHRLSTDSISMKITGKAEERAIIYLSLNLLFGTSIKAKLFPQYEI